MTKVSQSKSSPFDKFNLNNSVDLVLRVLKTDVLWIRFEKSLPPVSKQVSKNAFQLLYNAQSRKTLPAKLKDPFNQKMTLFNTAIDAFEEMGAKFSVAESAPRIKNRKSGEATELVYDVADILWKIKMAEKALRNRSLWGRVPNKICSLLKFDRKSHDQVIVTQDSVKKFVLFIREVTDKVIFSQPNLREFRISLLRTADVLADLADVLKSQAEERRASLEKQMKISSAAEAVIKQIGEKEKVSMLEKGSFTLTHSVIKDIASELLERGLYQPVNISTKLHSNRFSRSSLLHETLPRQITMRTILWSSENGGKSQQSVFAFMVGEEDSHQAVLDKVTELRPSLLSLQKIYLKYGQ